MQHEAHGLRTGGGGEILEGQGHGAAFVWIIAHILAHRHARREIADGLREAVGDGVEANGFP